MIKGSTYVCQAIILEVNRTIFIKLPRIKYMYFVVTNSADFDL